MFSLVCTRGMLLLLAFAQVLAELERDEDINQVREYFSYEHFYVIYCKFWELDADHDLLIDADDLAKYSEHGTLTTVPIHVLYLLMLINPLWPALCLYYNIPFRSDFTCSVSTTAARPTPTSWLSGRVGPLLCSA